MRCLVLTVATILSSTLYAADVENIAFPKSSHVVDVTKAPYNAKGDGTTDDTVTIQKALDDMMGQHKILYFPNGTYLISSTLRFNNKNSAGRNAYGFNWLQGQSTAKTILRLKDKTYTDATKAKPIIWGGGFGSADWFHNYVQNITFDIGNGNSGGIGIQYYSNNTGAIRDVLVKSGDGSGLIGLDVGFADMNGPLLAKNIEVRGFETGVRAAASVNSQTIEHLTVSGTSKVGLVNFGQHLSVRKFKFDGESSAVKTESFLALLDSEFTGTGKTKTQPAIELGQAPFLAKNVVTSGYAKSLSSGEQKLADYTSGKATNPFDVPVQTLGLPIEEPPVFGWDDPKTWAVAEAFGADPTGNKDSSAAIQKAIDSGRKTLFLPGFYQISKPIIVRGKVERIIGSGGWIDYLGKTTPNFIVADGDAKQVVIEHFANINGGVEVNTERTVVFRSLGVKSIKFKKAKKVFIEDVTTDDLRLIPNMSLWARQLNIENEGTHLTNDAATLWVLGYKTERGGTLLHTKNKGRSEIFGNYSYTTTAGKLAPMFITEDAEAFAFFGEVCYSGDPFSVWCKDKQGKNEKTLKMGSGGLAPYISRPPVK
jgi:hypothetical protein